MNNFNIGLSPQVTLLFEEMKKAGLPAGKKFGENFLAKLDYAVTTLSNDPKVELLKKKQLLEDVKLIRKATIKNEETSFECYFYWENDCWNVLVEFTSEDYWIKMKPHELN